MIITLPDRIVGMTAYFAVDAAVGEVSTDRIVLDFTITNVGTTTGVAEVERLSPFDSSFQHEADVELAPGESAGASPSSQGPFSPGDYTVGVRTQDDTFETTVTVGDPDPDPDPDPDESELDVELSEVSSPEPGVVEIVWFVENQITSGDGESLSDSVSIEVDGGVYETVSVSVSAGDIETFTTVIEGVAEGEREVCLVL